MKRLNVVIAYNPLSGSYNKARLDALGAAFAKSGYAPIFVDGHSDDMPGLALAADHLCIVGGDGSLRDAAARLADKDNLPPISVYPAGTINLVAREANYPANIENFVKRVTNDAPHRQHYLGYLNDMPILACASIGPDSMAVASLSEALKRRIGRFAYVAAFLKLLIKWPRRKMRLITDGGAHECEAVFILKGRFFAGPWQICPQADLTRPNFHLLMMPKARRRDYLRLMVSVIFWPAIASKKWKNMSVNSVRVEGDRDMPVQVDGDVAGTLPIKAEIAPNPILFS